MIKSVEAVDFFINDMKVSEFVGVYSNYLLGLERETRSRDIYKEFSDPRDAVAYAVGKQIADPTHRVCIMIDSVHIGSVIEVLTTNSELYQVPILMIVGNPAGDSYPTYNVLSDVSKELLQVAMIETGGVGIDLIHVDEDSYMLPIPDEYLNDSIIYFVNDRDVFDCAGAEVCGMSGSRYDRMDVIKVLSEYAKSNDAILVINGEYNIKAVKMVADGSNVFYTYGSPMKSASIAYGMASAYPDKKFIYISDNLDEGVIRNAENLQYINMVEYGESYSTTGYSSPRELKDLPVILNCMFNMGISYHAYVALEFETGNEYNDIESRSYHKIKWDLAKRLNPEVEVPEEPPVVDYTLPDEDDDDYEEVTFSPEVLSDRG